MFQSTRAEYSARDHLLVFVVQVAPVSIHARRILGARPTAQARKLAELEFQSTRAEYSARDRPGSALSRPAARFQSTRAEYSARDATAVTPRESS